MTISDTSSGNYPSFGETRHFRMIVGATEAIKWAAAAMTTDGRYEHVRALARIVDALPAEIFGGERPLINHYIGSIETDGEKSDA